MKNVQKNKIIVCFQICANTNKSTTFDELRRLTICAAKNLRNFGCQKGQIIFISSKNTGDIAPLVFAALCLGCPVASLPTCFSQAEYLDFLSFSKPEIVFCDPEIHSIFKECFDKLKINALFFTFDRQLDGTHSIDSLFATVDDSLYFE